MPIHDRPASGQALGDQRSTRIGQDQSASTAICSDPHPSWLREWKSLRAGLADGSVRAEELRMDATILQGKIARTPAATLSGLEAQAELISELAWNEVVAAASRQLLAGIKRLKKQTAT